MTYRPGDLAVFIGKGNFPRVRSTFPDLAVPQKDVIYTVRGLTFYNNTPGLRLEEICNPPKEFKEGVHEIAWDAAEFRPVVKPSISLLTALLAPEDLCVS